MDRSSIGKVDGQSLGSSERESGIELFRIIVMLLIIAHHYVVNSGLASLDGPIFTNGFQAKSTMLLLAGMWGKTGINCFVLITGYFMCAKQVTLKKFLKLLFEELFYRFLFFFVFIFAGYETLSFGKIIKLLLPITSVEHNFTGCFLIFFLLIPWLTALVDHLNKKNHLKLIAVGFFVYTILGTIPGIDVTFNYVTWFSFLFIIAAYLRFYPVKILEDTEINTLLLVFGMIIAMVSVVVLFYVTTSSYGARLASLLKLEPGFILCYYFEYETNMILALVLAILAFCFFKNIKIKQSRIINTIAASTYGVFLIHTISDTMRNFLWQHLFNNVGAYYTGNIYLHLICTVLCIFAVGTVIDMMRRRFLEKPFFDWYDRKEIKKKL